MHLHQTSTKTDERAAERLLMRAVERAVLELRAEHVSPAPDFDYCYERNVDRFHVAIRAVDMCMDLPVHGAVPS